MYVQTPGQQVIYPERVDHRIAQDGVVGVVLDVYLSTSAAFVPGPRCRVLLVESLQVVWDVLIPAGQGTGASSVQFVMPTPTSAEIIEFVEQAIAGEGAMPSPTSYNPGWGSWVTLDKIGNSAQSTLIIGKYLFHPATDVKRLPVVPSKTGPIDMAASMAIERLRATPDELPDELQDGDAIPANNPPYTFGKTPAMKAAWQAAFKAAWQAAAEAAYFGSTSVSRDSGAAYTGMYADAQADGWRQGWANGTTAGESARSKNPPEQRVATPPADEPVEQPEEAGDKEEDGAKPALPSGRDYILEHCGNRLIFFENGGIRIDTRAAGPIELQGGSGGVRLTAGGAIIDVGNGGKTVSVTADTILLGGNDSRAMLGDRMLAAFNAHTHKVMGAATLAPDQILTSEDVLSDKVGIGR